MGPEGFADVGGAKGADGALTGADGALTGADGGPAGVKRGPLKLKPQASQNWPVLGVPQRGQGSAPGLPPAAGPPMRVPQMSQ